MKPSGSHESAFVMHLISEIPCDLLSRFHDLIKTALDVTLRMYNFVWIDFYIPPYILILLFILFRPCAFTL